MLEVLELQLKVPEICSRAFPPQKSPEFPPKVRVLFLPIFLKRKFLSRALLEALNANKQPC